MCKQVGRLAVATGAIPAQRAGRCPCPDTCAQHRLSLGNENELIDVHQYLVLAGGRRSGRGRTIDKGKWTMNISSVFHVPPVTTPARLTASNVSAAALKAATGDGRTGAAALNDGDAAAQSARRGAIDVKA